MKLSNIAQNWTRNKKNTYVKGGNDFDGFLRLDIGEPWFPLTPDLERTLGNLSVDDFKKRPDIHCLKLRNAASKFWNVPAENIVVANGSDQFIWLLPRLFMNPADNAIVINPTFFLFSESVTRVAGKVISFTTSLSNKFEATEQIISDVINTANQNSVKIIWLCNPNNPTGSAISLDKILKIVKNTSALVIVDEAFFDISDLTTSESALSLVNKHTNIVVLKTMSKTFGLNNVRVGFTIANKELTKILEDWKLPFEVSHIAQEVGSVVLNDVVHWRKMKQALLTERDWVINKIGEIKSIELASPTKTTIFLIRKNEGDIFKLLLNKNILVSNFNICKGIEDMGFARITVKSRAENTKLISVLKKIDDCVI